MIAGLVGTDIPVLLSSTADAATARRADALCAAWGLTRHARDAVPDEIPALMVTRDGLALRLGGRLARWHDGLLHTRLAAGNAHPLVRLSGLGPGDLVLDCTLGLGADARQCAAITGRRVLGVEASLPLALLAREGLARAHAPVEVLIADAAALVRMWPARVVDVIVCDPMFPVDGRGPAASLDAVRAVAAPWVPDRAWLDDARRVARKAVIVRDTRAGVLLEALGTADRTHRRPGRLARYGAWDAR